MQRCVFCGGEIYPPVEGDPIHPDPSGCIAHFMAREEQYERRIADLEAEAARLRGEPVAAGMPPLDVPVQIIINARRGLLGDRWLTDGTPYPMLVRDAMVAAWRPREAPPGDNGDRS